jgi:PAS domain S-box-containing protein
MSSETTSGPQAQTQQSANRPATPSPVSGRRLLLAHPTAWIVLAVALAASAGGWLIVRNQADLSAWNRFDEEAQGIAAALEERMLIYQDVLHGAVGLYAASASVERDEWKKYVESVSIDKRFPGIDGLGFIECVRRADLDKFIQTTRGDKAPYFQVKNPGEGDELFITKYIEPLAQHFVLLGGDLSTVRQWKALAEVARDTGNAATSGTLKLAARTGGTQSGFLMMLPVYRNDQPRDTPAERRANIEGWVFARFITAQLMKDIGVNNSPTMYFTILDDTPGAGEKGIFESEPPPPDYHPKFSDEISLPVGGRQWQLVFATKPAFEATIPKAASALTAAGGVLLSLLLFGIVWSLSTTRERALAMASDMTAALRSANERLEYERYLLQTLMDNLPDRIYFKDRQNRFLRNNRAHLQRFDLQDPAQAIGKTDFDFFSEEHAREAYNDEQEVIRTGQPLTKEEKETWPDGAVTWALSTKMPLRDHNGQIVGTFGISRDITTRRQAEEAMRRAKEAAEDASRAKSHFLASMSHELRTPLNSIIGFANILLKNKGGTLTSAELNFLDRIQANGNHLLGLINEILDLSKIEAQKVELQMAPVALDQLVRDTVAQEEGLVRDKPVELRADLPELMAPILTDADKLRQVIINLIGNALKFTERGSVTVRVLTDPTDHQPIRLDVSDTGIGIPSDKLGVIFEAFQQGEAGTTRKYGGTGLGLTISQALCRLMGYRIEATSEVGRGSTFSIILRTALSAGSTLPAGSKAAPTLLAAPPPVTAQQLADMAGKLVLVIDDAADSRTLLTHMIEEAGCHVVSADSGELGLLMARKLRPHLITTDLLMPDMDGWQVLRALKTDPQLRSIPVVVISVIAGENRGRIFGAVEILQKPVEREELLGALKRCLLPPKPNILIVDDEEDARRVLTACLAEEVGEVRTAANGQQALDLMEHYSPDAVLLDLLMPVMDGVTFLNALRADPRHQHLPVVVITAKDLTSRESELLRQETLAVLKKAGAFEDELRRLLHRLLTGPQTSPAPPAVPTNPTAPLATTG